MAKILFQGHGSLRLTTNQGTTIYLDPFAGEGYEVPADIILVTHQHGDHKQIDKPAKKVDCVIYQEKDALVEGVYGEIQIKDVHIRAVPAYNQNHKKDRCVGYIVSVDGQKIYFAGDTSKIVEMEDLKKEQLDYAFLPVDGFYNMDVTEAIECAKIIGAKHTIPIHMVPTGESWTLFSEEKADAFKEFEGSLIIRPGEEVTL